MVGVSQPNNHILHESLSPFAHETDYLADRSADSLNRHSISENSISTSDMDNSNPFIPSTPESSYSTHPSQSQSTGSPTAEALCATVPGLVSQQLRVCEAHPNAMLGVSEGARRGIVECQQQFKNERWNCTPEGEFEVFGHTLQRGSRETAFLYAITSAGVVHAITQSCSAGNLTDCSCDRSRQGQSTPDGWKWGGCSDNIRYGMLFAKHFVDAPERLARKRNRDLRAMMNLHNNHAGRLSAKTDRRAAVTESNLDACLQAISNQMELKCRCHGVSGSCELKTCWRTLPAFTHVGNYLKQKYEHSIQISQKAKKRLRRRGKVKRKVPVRKEDLVHIHKSPNYCIEDSRRGILGTGGRQCNKTSTSSEGCNLLCCGRGYNTQVFRKLERCHCKFHWCCHVTCSTCENLMEIYTCK
ncbi:Wnt16 like-like protein [Leptotrombidium deliense]|uniref:Protein Wnt n=1 Tax=Leptotrombidium deliense TaxID=299467 RepID=A0A443SR03_9ACAR|nr:Wnt16 like-like protein [Leptotrombidium deliense]